MFNDRDLHVKIQYSADLKGEITECVMNVDSTRLFVIGFENDHEIGWLHCLDPRTGALIFSRTIGNDLRAITYSTVMNYICIADSGPPPQDNSGISPSAGILHILDENGNSLHEVAVAINPHSMTIDQKSGHVFVCCWAFDPLTHELTAENLYMCDLNGTLLKKITVGEDTETMVFSQSLQRLIISVSGDMVIVDSSSGTVLHRVKVGKVSWENLIISDRLGKVFVPNSVHTIMNSIDIHSGVLETSSPTTEIPLLLTLNQGQDVIAVLHKKIRTGERNQTLNKEQGQKVVAFDNETNQVIRDAYVSILEVFPQRAEQDSIFNKMSFLKIVTSLKTFTRGRSEIQIINEIDVGSTPSFVMYDMSSDQVLIGFRETNDILLISLGTSFLYSKLRTLAFDKKWLFVTMLKKDELFIAFNFDGASQVALFTLTGIR